MGTSANSISVIDGRAHFKDTTQLRAFMKYARQADFNSDYLTLLRNSENIGFYSLYPEYDESEENKIRQTFLRKSLERQKWQKSYSNLRTLTEVGGEIEDDDEIIADPYFASVLNTEREIQVGDYVYKYALEGLYQVKAGSVDDLYEYLAISVPETAPNLSGEQIEITEGILLIRPSKEEDNFCEDCNEPSGSGRIMSEPDISSFHLCDKLKKNLWTSIFGPKTECIDQFDGQNRVKTQVWNQNYVLFSSIGFSVKSSRKTLGIWWSKKIDELRLGFDYVAFKYPSIKMEWPDHQSSYYFANDKGYYMDQWGRAMNPNALHPINFFASFPINDKDRQFFKIITRNAFIKSMIKNCKDSEWEYCTIAELTGATVNRHALSLFKQVWNYTRTKLDSKPVLVIEMPDDALAFTYLNWKDTKSDASALRNVFDWNTAQIKITLNGSTNFVNPGVDIKTSAQSYKELSLSGYGIGRKGDQWKGGRIQFHDTK